MKNLVFAVIATLAIALSTVAAQQKKVGGGQAELAVTDAEKAAKKAAAKQRAMEKTGGVVFKDGQGKIVVVNCQSKIKDEAVQKKIAEYAKFIRVKFEYHADKPIASTDVFARCPNLPFDSNAALYIVDDPKLPMSLSAIEQHWSLINIANINETRFGKLFARGVIMAFGGGFNPLRGSPMQTVSKPEDLDKVVTEGLTFDAINSILKNLQNLGVTQTRISSYRKACQEGWAAAPTNKFQQAIWEEVHAKPTNPMRIKFDPQKGE